jgi:hypothetical protein
MRRVQNAGRSATPAVIVPYVCQWVTVLLGIVVAHTGWSAENHVPPYPRATIVAQVSDDALLPRAFVTGAVDKTRREVRFDEGLRVKAARVAVTYEMPPEASLAGVIDHYRDQLQEAAVYSCRGRDCGRSNHWANGIFDEAILFGPDQHQFYLAAQRADELIAVYVIQRGNRRIYAHVERLLPDQPVQLDPSPALIQQLAATGHVVARHIEPGLAGVFSADGEAALRALGERLDVFPRQRVYVVCHQYGRGSESVEELLDRSTACAESARTQLAAGLGSGLGPELIPWGVGPLAPGGYGARSRIELVVPSRLPRD